MSRGLLVNLNPFLGSGSADRGGAFCAVSYYSPVNRSLFLDVEPVAATSIPTTFKPQDPRLRPQNLKSQNSLPFSTFLYPTLLFAALQASKPSRLPRDLSMFINVMGRRVMGHRPSDSRCWPCGSEAIERRPRWGPRRAKGGPGAIERSPRWGPRRAKGCSVLSTGEPAGVRGGRRAVRCYRQATPLGSGKGEGRFGAIDRRPRW